VAGSKKRRSATRRSRAGGPKGYPARPTLSWTFAGRRPSLTDQKRVVIAGAGLGGVCAGIHLKRAGIEDFVILERESEPGGTWRDNSGRITQNWSSHTRDYAAATKVVNFDDYVVQRRLKAGVQNAG